MDETSFAELMSDTMFVSCCVCESCTFYM